jgi:hypothetical protein
LEAQARSGSRRPARARGTNWKKPNRLTAPCSWDEEHARRALKNHTRRLPGASPGPGRRCRRCPCIFYYIWALASAEQIRYITLLLATGGGIGSNIFSVWGILSGTACFEEEVASSSCCFPVFACVYCSRVTESRGLPGRFARASSALQSSGAQDKVPSHEVFPPLVPLPFRCSSVSQPFCLGHLRPLATGAGAHRPHPGKPWNRWAAAREYARFCSGSSSGARAAQTGRRARRSSSPGHRTGRHHCDSRAAALL